MAKSCNFEFFEYIFKLPAIQAGLAFKHGVLVDLGHFIKGKMKYAENSPTSRIRIYKSLKYVGTE